MTGPVRPYVITGGRSRPTRAALAVESLVSALPDRPELPEDALLSREHHRILDLCRSLLSIAEVAAHLRLPLGIVKVLVGDLWDLGTVQVLPPVPQAERLPATLLEEVLVGLRQLR
ncbi:MULTISPECIES: DUF742 domain-containing protein [Streptomycetaceae]|uniref:DUF742 domain-containing protein n=1 Tax=Streptomycetaceae TaxID=2062 RepID=UPI000CDC2263|nr:MULTISPECIES: DUF742 domain-containing protein [Streptomycetaceae]AUY50366.1 hypothetical protein C2142_17115 [Streptomyces sp. CB01881]MBP0451869.1 DUF742 domain-containing protein [Kitasatospora sp. RG8]TYC73753.1 DUF742 domain-containing protein [Streptomyces sp. CB01881]